MASSFLEHVDVKSKGAALTIGECCCDSHFKHHDAFGTCRRIRFDPLLQLSEINQLYRTTEKMISGLLPNDGQPGS